jgi:RimJ/RimL family protein N-acetyltransferase
MRAKAWFPDELTGSTVVLRRHTAANLVAVRRWYSDPEIGRLARRSETPMTEDEIERYFERYVIGPESLAMAVHECRTGRLIGSCAFSALDPDNGSALYHITIGEKDTWGRGHGTEATQLMLDHAFGTLGLHRIGLTVFAFNERAIRAYRRCGFAVEGRARQAIWRDGEFWDELWMSILRPDWETLRAQVAQEQVGDIAQPLAVR